ncbi:DUF1993 family protein [Aliagarivorans marinus]|uniref:DUF1993 family protein n=1 Tax=Aliagarivorans marinus TaxID=561965 RepID=UPI00041B18BC|nr:DUF1993 family protein [Aliagarivorans marinus]
MDIKALFSHHLSQLQIIVEKTPESSFEQALCADMLNLAMHAKIAANFAIRGYAPLVGIEPVLVETDSNDKAAVLAHIEQIIGWLEQAPDKEQLSAQRAHTERLGFATAELAEPQFIHQLVLPNLLFHMAMVYAIARSHDVPLSKGDFDGLHSYPAGFSFVEP